MSLLRSLFFQLRQKQREARPRGARISLRDPFFEEESFLAHQKWSLLKRLWISWRDPFFEEELFLPQKKWIPLRDSESPEEIPFSFQKRELFFMKRFHLVRKNGRPLRHSRISWRDSNFPFRKIFFQQKKWNQLIWFRDLCRDPILLQEDIFCRSKKWVRLTHPALEGQLRRKKVQVLLIKSHVASELKPL